MEGGRRGSNRELRGKHEQRTAIHSPVLQAHHPENPGSRVLLLVQGLKNGAYQVQLQGHHCRVSHQHQPK
ncbi:hypothetical protein SLA2020_412260 [Shorea laevis]